jgi:hypothetical protein
MDAKIELRIDYETLVAVVREALPGKFHWVDFDEESMLGCTVFKLRQRQLGDNLGEVMVRKVVDRSDLSYHGPQRLLDRRDPTQEEIDTLKAARPDMDWLQRGDELWRKIREEGDELHRRREEHFGKVIKAMFSGLYHDPILQRTLLAEGNVLQLKFLARLAGEKLELPQPTEAEPQVDSGAVGEGATAAEDAGGKKEDLSCFISYSSKDQTFAEQLHNDLQDAGVRCWFAPEDMRIGDRIRPTIDQAVRSYDKLLLVLSKHSIDSDWVEREVETASEEERKRKKTMLFPIRLDSAVMKTDQAWAADIRRTRYIGDFTHWKDHDAYQKAFERLLRDLKAEEEVEIDA